MQLFMDAFHRIAAIPWLSHCGESSRPEFGPSIVWVDNRLLALQSMFSTQWAGAITRAQGTLTGYLAKTDYETYGTTWNKLVKESRVRLDTNARSWLLKAIRGGAWSESLAHVPLPILDRGARASLGVQLASLLEAKEWEQSLSYRILVEVNLSVIELTYRRKFSKTPTFFERLLGIYEAGRLPCGWDGDLDNWPEGTLLVH